MMYTSFRGGKPGRSVDATILLVPKLAQVRKGDRPDEAALGRALDAAGQRPEFSGDVGSFVDLDEAGRRVIVLSIGETEKHEPQQVRIAAAKLTGALHARKLANLELVVSPAAMREIQPGQIGQAFAEGVALAAFRYDRFKKDDDTGPKQLSLRSADTDLRRGITDGFRLGESANYARQLQATPPNIATPYYIASEAKRLAGESGSRLTCKVIRGDALVRQRFVGLWNVGKASDHKPCMIQLSYRSKKRNAPTVVLVGKTLTFDCGGLSLKISGGMRYMKYDKSGGMAVLGAMHAIRNRDLGCHVVALLPAAENAISDEAYRVDDILEYPNGVSVEITNTDAEGRLVLADALHYGCRKFKPAAIIDLATLTGAVVAALGDHMAGLFTADDALRQRVQQAGEASGEAVWPMPITQEHRDALASNHADIVNAPLKVGGGACTAAAFLERFVDPPATWAHLDIAGPVMVDKPHPIFTAGPTGFGTRLLVHLLESWGR